MILLPNTSGSVPFSMLYHESVSLFALIAHERFKRGDDAVEEAFEEPFSDQFLKYPFILII